MTKKYKRMEVVPGEIEKLKADLAAAKLQIREAKAMEQAFNQREAALEKRAEDAERLIETLKKNFYEYSQHNGQCPMDRSQDGDTGCVCGLMDLLKQIEKRNDESIRDRVKRTGFGAE